MTSLLSLSLRLKKDISSQTEELRSFKKRALTMQTEVEQLRLELDRAHPKLEKLNQYEQELYNVTEQNTLLRSELTTLQDHYESILNERDDLEQQTKEVYEALNEEREAKSILETKLHVDMFKTPDRWTESTSDMITSSAPTSPGLNVDHSTPFTATSNAIPCLLSELQHSLLPIDLPSTSQSLELKIQELEGKLETEKDEMEKQMLSTLSDLETWKMKYQESIESNDTELASIRDELSAKKEIANQLKSKVSSLSGEKASLEIELDGVKDEMIRSKELSHMEREKLLKEMTEEQRKNSQLQGRICELDEKLSNAVNAKETLETILVHSTGEVISIKEEILNLNRAISSLHNENKVTPASDTNLIKSEAPSNETTSDEYLLSVQEGKKNLRINRENHMITEVIQLRELLHQVRIPLETFTRRMLERSLESSSQHMVGITTSTRQDDDKKITTELEGTINKFRARLANRTEEVNQLRTIMKARQTTVDVTVSSLKSKLESQARAHDTEINQFKHKLKTLRKERDDQTSLCALTSKRCQEYLVEISKLKRKLEEAKGEKDCLLSEAKLLDVYLQRAIKQKLDISQQLERYHEEEERNKVIPLTLSASRV